MGQTKLQKINSILIFSFLVIIAMYYGASFLIPLTFAIFLSTLILPICNLLEEKLKIGRVLASFISTIFLFLVLGGLFFILFRQLSMFMNDLLEKREDILGFVEMVQHQIVDSTGLTLEEQERMFKDRLAGLIQEAQTYLSSIISDFSGILFSFLLMLIYVLLMLVNRDKFADFIMKYVSDEKEQNVEEMLNKVKKVANRYLWGRVQVMMVLAIMFAVTFFAYDLEYSALLIIFGVLVTIIPYVGPFLSGLFPIVFMLIMSENSAEIISFSIIVVIIQLIESYVLEPVIIGSKVRQSPLFVIIAIVLGSAIWGVAGLILFVPLFGVMKIIFDNTKGLEPAGFLIGYETKGDEKNIFIRLRNKLKGVVKE